MTRGFESHDRQSLYTSYQIQYERAEAAGAEGTGGGRLPSPPPEPELGCRPPLGRGERLVTLLGLPNTTGTSPPAPPPAAGTEEEGGREEEDPEEEEEDPEAPAHRSPSFSHWSLLRTTPSGGSAPHRCAARAAAARIGWAMP